MELRINDYVRNENGLIGKIIGFKGDMVETDNKRLITYKSNHSECKIKENIIDLIEVGDYVNGRKVYQAGYNFQDDLVLKMSINADGTPNNFEDFIYEKDIKSIVTKEQFESMKYEVN